MYAVAQQQRVAEQYVIASGDTDRLLGSAATGHTDPPNVQEDLHAVRGAKREHNPSIVDGDDAQALLRDVGTAAKATGVVSGRAVGSARGAPGQGVTGAFQRDSGGRR